MDELEITRAFGNLISTIKENGNIAHIFYQDASKAVGKEDDRSSFGLEMIKREITATLHTSGPPHLGITAYTQQLRNERSRMVTQAEL